MISVAAFARMAYSLQPAGRLGYDYDAVQALLIIVDVSRIPSDSRLGRSCKTQHLVEFNMTHSLIGAGIEMSKSAIAYRVLGSIGVVVLPPSFKQRSFRKFQTHY